MKKSVKMVYLDIDLFPKLEKINASGLINELLLEYFKKQDYPTNLTAKEADELLPLLDTAIDLENKAKEAKAIATKKILELKK